MNKFPRRCLSAGIIALLALLVVACASTANPTAGQGPSATQAATALITQASATTHPAATKTPKPKSKTKPKPKHTPTPAPTKTPVYTDSATAAQAVFKLINQERAGKGLPALTWSTGLVRSAHLHNLLMLKDNTLSHQLPGEAGLFPRINAQGISGSMVAENIGYGWGNVVQAATGLNVSMFNEKPPDDGHRLNILSKATIIGIDVIINPKNNQVWLTEDFAEV